MRLINADALMETINRHCYPVQHDMTSIEPGMTRIGILQAIQEQPTIEPPRKTDEWCSDCKEYDQEKHCCTRWNRVIRQTLTETIKHYAQYPDGMSRLLEVYGAERRTDE